MEEEIKEEIPREKIKKAARILLFKRHMKPGIKGWELKRLLGKNYLKILDILKTELERIGLTIKVFFEESEEKNFSKATFYVVLKEHPSFVETRAFGMRIDDLAALAASIVYILSRGGKAPSKEVEKMLAKKIIKTRVSYLVDKFIKMGYLSEDEKGMLYLGWRTLVEVNRENLLSMIFAKSSSESAKE